LPNPVRLTQMVLIQDAGTQDPVSSLDEICQHCTREQRTHIKNTEGKVKISLQTVRMHMFQFP
jgi:hypothetical protein